jgi:hypothetical protein
MTTLHAEIEMVMLAVGGLTCAALLVIRVLLLAFDDLRRTWKDISKG